MAYTAKDITVLEGLEPVRRRPGMYIGGVGSTGLHHLVWEILDNSIDEAMNGHASNIWVTLHKDGSSITIEDDGRGIPVDKHGPSKKSALEVIFTVLHAGGKFDHDNYKTAGGLHGVGASVVNALSKELVATVRRDGAEWEQRFKQGKPLGPLKKIGSARGSGTKVFFHPDPGIFPKIELEAAIIRERLEVASYLHKGLKISFEDESEKTKETFEHSEGLLAYLRKIVSRAGREAGARRGVLAGEAERHAGRPRAAMDRGDRRAHSQLRQRHSDRIRRHARKRDARGSGQGGAQLHRYAQPVAEGRDADGRGHPRRADRRAQRLRVRAAVSGADQGSPQQPRSAVGRRFRRPSGPRALAEYQPDAGRVDRRARDSRGPRARSEPRRPGGGHAQERDVGSLESSRQAQRLHRHRPIGFGALRRRRRFGRAGRQNRDAIGRARRFCRCAARC